MRLRKVLDRCSDLLTIVVSLAMIYPTPLALRAFLFAVTMVFVIARNCAPTLEALIMGTDPDDVEAFLGDVKELNGKTRRSDSDNSLAYSSTSVLLFEVFLRRVFQLASELIGGRRS